MPLVSLGETEIDKILNELGYGDGDNGIISQVNDANDILNSTESSENEKFLAQSFINTYGPVTENIESIRNSIKESINSTVDEINTKFEDVQNFAENTVKNIEGELTDTFNNTALGFSNMSSVTFTVTTTTGTGTSVPVPPTAFSGGVASQLSNINSQVENTKSTLGAQLKQKLGFLKEITTKINSLKPYLDIAGSVDTKLFDKVTNLLNEASDLIDNLPTLSIT